MHPKRRSHPIAFGGDPFAVGFEQFNDPHRGVERLVGGLRDAIEKKLKPSLPGAVFANLLQQAIVVGAMGLQIEAEIEERLPQDVVDAQIQRHQEAADAAVAVQERMQGLELNMEQARLDQGRQARGVLVHEALEGVEASLQLRHGRRYEESVSRPGPTDPVLRAAEFARVLGCAAPALQKALMHLAHQPQ